MSTSPHGSGNIYSTAALTESVFNILGGSIMILFPTYCLSWMSNTTPPSTAAVSMTQWLGALTLGLTPELLLSRRTTRAAFESRPMVYVTLLAGEGFLVPLMLWQAVGNDGGGNGSSSASGFTTMGLITASGVLASTAVWRLLVLFGRPDWFGGYVEEMKEEKKRL